MFIHQTPFGKIYMLFSGTLRELKGESRTDFLKHLTEARVSAPSELIRNPDGQQAPKKKKEGKPSSNSGKPSKNKQGMDFIPELDRYRRVGEKRRGFVKGPSRLPEGTIENGYIVRGKKWIKL